MRTWLLLLGLVVCAGGCKVVQGNGAVLVRWRFSATPSGASLTDCTIRIESAQIDVTIDRMVLAAARLPDPDADALPDPEQRFGFDCTDREGTTPFDILPGTYQIRLEARGCGGQKRLGLAPPPVVRRISSGEIANIGAVEILIPPCERSDCENPDALPACTSPDLR